MGYLGVFGIDFPFLPHFSTYGFYHENPFFNLKFFLHKQCAKEIKIIGKLLLLVDNLSNFCG
jgi:hypothetical protein